MDVLFGSFTEEEIGSMLVLPPIWNGPKSGHSKCSLHSPDESQPSPQPSPDATIPQMPPGSASKPPPTASTSIKDAQPKHQPRETNVHSLEASSPAFYPGNSSSLVIQSQQQMHRQSQQHQYHLQQQQQQQQQQRRFMYGKHRVDPPVDQMVVHNFPPWQSFPMQRPWQPAPNGVYPPGPPQQMGLPYPPGPGYHVHSLRGDPIFLDQRQHLDPQFIHGNGMPLVMHPGGYMMPPGPGMDAYGLPHNGPMDVNGFVHLNPQHMMNRGHPAGMLHDNSGHGSHLQYHHMERQHMAMARPPIQFLPPGQQQYPQMFPNGDYVPMGPPLQGAEYPVVHQKPSRHHLPPGDASLHAQVQSQPRNQPPVPPPQPQAAAQGQSPAVEPVSDASGGARHSPKRAVQSEPSPSHSAKVHPDSQPVGKENDNSPEASSAPEPEPVAAATETADHRASTTETETRNESVSAPPLDGSGDCDVATASEENKMPEAAQVSTSASPADPPPDPHLNVAPGDKTAPPGEDPLSPATSDAAQETAQPSQLAPGPQEAEREHLTGSAATKSWVSVLKSQNKNNSAVAPSNAKPSRAPKRVTAGVHQMALVNGSASANSAGPRSPPKQEAMAAIETSDALKGEGWLNSLRMSDASGKLRVVPSGLFNTGNLCFLNSLLQALLGLFEFQYLLLNIAAKDWPLDKYPVLKAFVDFIGQFTTKALASPPRNSRGHKQAAMVEVGKPFPPSMFGEVRDLFVSKQKNPNPLRQEDAEEFLAFLLDELHGDLVALESSVNGAGSCEEQSESAVDDIFGGIIRSVVKPDGVAPSVTVQAFRILNLDIHLDSVQSVEEALELYFSQEIVPYKVDPAQDWWGTASKFFNLQHPLPRILVLRLKRFGFGNKAAHKLAKSIAFSPSLTLPAHVVEPSDTPLTSRTYDLVATVSHHGSDGSAGHYTADVKHESGVWLRFDDARVFNLPHFRDLDDQPYVLMYKRCQP